MLCFIVYMCLALQLIKLRMFSILPVIINDMVCVYSIARLMPCPADFGAKFYEDKKV